MYILSAIAEFASGKIEQKIKPNQINTLHLLKLILLNKSNRLSNYISLIDKQIENL